MVKKKQKDLGEMPTIDRYRNFLETSHDWVWEVDENFICTYSNSKVYDILGFTSKEVIGKCAFDFMSEEESRRLRDVLIVSGSPQPMVNLRNNNLHKDGSVVVLESNGNPLFDDVGNFRGYAGVNRDITAQLDYEERLQFLSKAVNQIKEGIAVFDSSGTIGYVNVAFALMHGHEAENMIGKHFSFFCCSERVEEILFSKSGVRQRQLTGEHLHCHKDGHQFPCQVSISLFCDEKDNPSGVIVTARDISDAKSSEENLKLSEEKFQAFTKASMDMIFLIDERGSILYANPISERLLGYTIDDLKQMNVHDLVHPDDQEMAQRDRETHLAQKNLLRSIEIRLKRRDETYIYVEVNGFYLATVGSSVTLGAIIRDISERKENEIVLEKSRNYMKEQASMLENKNIALNELLSQIELEKRYIKESVVANIEKLVFPLIKKMRSTSSSVDSKYLAMLESNLTDLTSSFGHKIADKNLLLTPREVELCNLIKNGISNKEISNMLHISLETTETHRSNIRRKLGLANKSINLAVYLRSM